MGLLHVVPPAAGPAHLHCTLRAVLTLSSAGSKAHATICWMPCSNSTKLSGEIWMSTTLQQQDRTLQMHTPGAANVQRAGATLPPTW
jgi:hypothetical protein